MAKPQLPQPPEAHPGDEEKEDDLYPPPGLGLDDLEAGENERVWSPQAPKLGAYKSARKV